MTVKNQFILSIIFIISSLSAIAQNHNYRVGYIIRQSNDTLQGYIYNGTDIQHTSSVRFKAEVSQSAYETFTPADIQGYTVGNDKFYVSGKVTVNQEIRSLFLREVVSGYADFYFAKEKSGEDMYFLRKNGGEIIYIKKNILMGVLGSYLADCKEMNFSSRKSAIKYTYGLTSLTQTISTYNACVKPGEPSLVKMKPVKLPITKGVKIGFNTSNISYLSEGGTYYEADFQGKTGITGGLYLNFPLSATWSIQPELFYVQKGASLQRPFATTPLYREEVNFNLSYLQLPLLLKYTVRGNTFRPFINIGPSISYLMSKEAMSRTVRTSTNTESKKTNIELDNVAFGYRVGLGAIKSVTRKNAVSIEVLYDKSFTNLNYVYNGISLPSFQLIVGFSF